MGDQVKDPNYVGKFYLTKTHRPAVWEYVWLSADGQKLFLRHFCTDGACTETSPEGSGDYCCWPPGIGGRRARRRLSSSAQCRPRRLLRAFIKRPLEQGNVSASSIYKAPSGARQCLGFEHL